MDSVIGIDLSGLSRATKGRTVAAHVALESPPRLIELRRIRPGQRGDVDLLDWIASRDPSLVGIDAPLSLPHSVLCELTECERCRPGEASYLSRDVDLAAGGMPTVMLAAITFRGMYLARRLREVGTRVIEVYPRASFRSLGWDGRPATVNDGWKLIASLVEGVEVGTRDDLDAICAALVAVQVAQGRAREEEGTDGAIWIAVR